MRRHISDYLQAVQEAEEEEAMEPSCSQTAASMSKPKAMSFFPLWKLKGSQPAVTPSHEWHTWRKKVPTRGMH